MADGARPHVAACLRGWGIATLCAWVVLSACTGQDESARVREWLRGGVERAERHDLAGLSALTTEGFRAEPGGRDRDGVREVLAMAFHRYRGFRILYPYPAVEISSDGMGASVAVPLLVVRREVSMPGVEGLRDDPQGWLAQVGDHADLYHLELELVKRHGEWLANAAHLR